MNIKIKPTFYRINVSEGKSMAFLICQTYNYNYDSAENFFGVEYWELVSSFKNEGLTIPSSRPATFKEELRVLHQAVSGAKDSRENEINHIEKKLKTAYGDNITINLQQIKD